MDSLTGVCIGYLQNEHKHNAQILEMITKRLQHLRLSTEKKKAQIQDTQLQAAQIQRPRSHIAAAESTLEVDLSLLDEMEELLKEKALAVKRTTELLEKLKVESVLNTRIMKSWTEKV
jgi:hypothetical protein